MENKLVSIIIATKNEAKNIEKLLISIKEQTYPNIEVIVVDNFSTDKTRFICRKFTQRVYTKGPERSSQRNYGAKVALGEYVLFLDADMTLPPSIVMECVEKIGNENELALIIPEDVPEDGLFAKVKRLEKRLYWNESLIEAPRFFVTQAFRAIGGYNEDLIAAEDWDIAIRIREIGQVGRTTTALLHYDTNLKKELSHKKYYLRSIAKYALLHPKEFKHQSGFARVKLMWKKRQQLCAKPILSLILIGIKMSEFVLFNCFRKYGKKN